MSSSIYGILFSQVDNIFSLKIVGSWVITSEGCIGQITALV